MKLSELRAHFEKIIDENPDKAILGLDADSFPVVPFAELPASLKKNVRENVTPERLRDFLFKIVANNDFDKLVSSIQEETLSKILIHTRNVAKYTIEPNITLSPKEETQGYFISAIDFRVNLSAGDALTAFKTVLEQHKNPATADNSKPSNSDGAPPVSVLQEIQQPDEITFPKDLVTRKLFNNELPTGQTGRVISGGEITVTDKAGKKTKAPIAPIVTVSLLDLPPNIQITREMTQDDDSVFRAICSLWAAGNSKFTGQAIYAAMTGNPDAKATPAMLATIDECWTRQTSTQIELDTGTVGDAYNFKRWKRNRRVIEGGKDTITIGNQFGQTATTVYTMLEEPMLQTYANAINQTIRFPRAVLNTPINKTPDVIALQNFMLDHICAIPRISNHILYETIWKAMHLQGNTPAIEKRKEKMRNHIRKMLAYWKEIKFIARWKEVKQGNTLHHIEIMKPTPKELPTAKQTPEKTGGIPGKSGG